VALTETGISDMRPGLEIRRLRFGFRYLPATNSAASVDLRLLDGVHVELCEIGELRRAHRAGAVHMPALLTGLISGFIRTIRKNRHRLTASDL
jgi:hypothetical protein